MADNGCSWQAVLHGFAHHNKVRKHFVRWKERGLLEMVNDALRPQVREAEGRNAELKVGSLDSPSLRTSGKGGHLGLRRGEEDHSPQALHRRKHAGLAPGGADRGGVDERVARGDGADPGPV